MSKNPVHDTYRQDLPDAPLTADDIRQLQFGIALRGYAMGQVDDVLDRLAREIAERDADDRRTDRAGDGSRSSPTSRRSPCDRAELDDDRTRERPARDRGRDRRAAHPGLGRAGRLARPVPLDPLHHRPDRRPTTRPVWAYGPPPCPGSGWAGSRSGCSTGSWSPAGRHPAGTDGRRGPSSRCCTSGPYFTGEGVFALQGQAAGTTVTCVELFDLPGGRLLDPAGRLLLPVLRHGFRAQPAAVRGRLRVRT